MADLDHLRSLQNNLATYCTVTNLPPTALQLVTDERGQLGFQSTLTKPPAQWLLTSSQIQALHEGATFSTGVELVAAYPHLIHDLETTQDVPWRALLSDYYVD